MNQNNKDSWQKVKILRAHEHQEKAFETLNGHSFIRRIGKRVLLDDNQYYTEFMSCSYLGLDQDYRLVEQCRVAFMRSGTLFSAARTRLKYNGLDHLEILLNEIFAAKTVLFSSTHLAHLGFIPLLGSGTLPGFPIESRPAFILDKSVHSSIQINIGLMKQFGSVHKVNFQDLTALETLLAEVKAAGITPILMSDSVGSMGRLFPIKALASLALEYKGYLYIDDAHGMSVYGKNGNGYVLRELDNKLPDHVILVTSLAKGFGTYGGVIVVNNPQTIDFIQKYCSTYIFSGPPITALISSSIESAKIHLSPEITELQEELQNKIQLFDSLILSPEKILNHGLDVPIRAWKIGDELTTINRATKLKESGVLATAAMFPTVPKGNGIIRFGLCAKHTKGDITKLCTIINKLS